MNKIRLNKDEFNYLFNSLKIPLDLLNEIKQSSNIDNKGIVIQITDDIADRLRDLCGNQLQLEGFDESYELTKSGKILESLIDKFYIE